MPLLTKSTKKHISQSKNGFKIPYADHKHKLKDILDNKLNEPDTKKAYLAFVDRLSQEEHRTKSSSPKLTDSRRKENKEKSLENTKGAQKRKLSFDTEEILSQEVLNSDEVKTAYVEFMNNSMANEKNVNIYSSSEELFDDVVESFRSNKSKSSKGKVTEKKSKKETKKKSQSTKKPKNVKPSNEHIEDSVTDDEFSKLTALEKMHKKDKKVTKKKSQSTKKPKNRKPSNKHIEKNYVSDDEFPGLTPPEKMNKLYEKRNVGLYVLCDKCDKARYLPHVVDPLDLPDKWYCIMNPDTKHNKCSDPEQIEEDPNFLIDNLYNAGSIVFVKMEGYPWWPAMIEDDVDTETYFWLEGNSMSPTFYHVTFFDAQEVTRSWIRTENIAPFMKNMEKRQFQISIKYKYKSRINVAVKQALDAANMPLIDRLRTYGFLKRYKKLGKRNKNTKNKKQSECHRELFPLDDDEMSAILSNVNISDFSFNSSASLFRN